MGLTWKHIWNMLSEHGIYCLSDINTDLTSRLKLLVIAKLRLYWINQPWNRCHYFIVNLDLKTLCLKYPAMAQLDYSSIEHL